METLNHQNVSMYYVVNDNLYVFLIIEEYDFYSHSTHLLALHACLYFCVFYTVMPAPLTPKTTCSTDAYSVPVVVLSGQYNIDKFKILSVLEHLIKPFLQWIPSFLLEKSVERITINHLVWE